MTSEQTPRITLELFDRPAAIDYDGRTIAASSNALYLAERGYPPRLYWPRAAITGARLETSATRTHCPFKGDATYFDLIIGETRLADAAWSYTDPIADVAEIEGRVAFDHPALTIA